MDVFRTAIVCGNKLCEVRHDFSSKFGVLSFQILNETSVPFGAHNNRFSRCDRGCQYQIIGIASMAMITAEANNARARLVILKIIEN